MSCTVGALPFLLIYSIVENVAANNASDANEKIKERIKGKKLTIKQKSKKIDKTRIVIPIFALVVNLFFCSSTFLLVYLCKATPLFI